MVSSERVARSARKKKNAQKDEATTFFSSAPRARHLFSLGREPQENRMNKKSSSALKARH
jgi:hypothetical protein